MRPLDTSPEAYAIQTEALRRMSGGERVRVAVEMSQLIRKLARDGLRREQALTTEDIFRRIAGALGTAGVPYMLTGSFASAHWGTARSTQDIDLVIAPTEEGLRQFIGLLAPTQYYVSLDAALDALRRHSMFNVIDHATGWKIDLIIRKPRPFSEQEFERRKPVDIDGVDVFIASAEDVVISKLEWAKKGGSLRQIEDVAGILRVRTSLDRLYIEKWVRELGLGEQWAAARVGEAG